MMLKVTVRTLDMMPTLVYNCVCSDGPTGPTETRTNDLRRAALRRTGTLEPDESRSFTIESGACRCLGPKEGV